MKYFNTSGYNIQNRHYTIKRKNILTIGIALVKEDRYLTIFAPRQTGKSTYFRQLAEAVKELNYKPIYFSVEGYNDFPVQAILKELNICMREQTDIKADIKTFAEFTDFFRENQKDKFVIIIDEIEDFNPQYLNQFLHTVRNLYHSRSQHSLKSVVFVGAKNILGVIEDNSSPFNIADNLKVPYFTKKEVHELLELHETETKQLIETEAKDKIFQITAGQPGLVCGFAKKLIENEPDKKILTYADYLKVEDWYLTEAIDKNFANILNKAKKHRHFVEKLLFKPDKVHFDINRESIKELHTHGLIKKTQDGSVCFWVPFYKKRLYKAFYPYTNGEQSTMLRTFITSELFDNDKNLKLDTLINGFKTYVKRRGFNVFREKDKNGKYKSIKESALIYSFETYIQAFLITINGKSYREANTGLGKSDLIINVFEKEFLIETKIYYYEAQFLEGKQQLAYYCQSLELNKGIYIVFVPNDIKIPKTIKESKETINNVKISTYIIFYDDTKWK